MNKSLALKNKIYLFSFFLLTLFMFMYLLYFLINGERGVISYYKFKNENLEYKKILLNLKLENAFISDRVKRLETNSIDLDFLDEKLREKTGFIDSNEILVVFE